MIKGLNYTAKKPYVLANDHLNALPLVKKSLKVVMPQHGHKSDWSDSVDLIFYNSMALALVLASGFILMHLF